MLTAPLRRQTGVTLIELLIAIALLAILLKLAAPSFATWNFNSQVRSVADTLANGLRTAQIESVRRSRQVVFTLTNETPGADSEATDNGVNWAIHTVPLPGEAAEFIQGGQLGDVAGAVTITGPGATCFNSVGRRTANADPGVDGAECTISAGTPTIEFDVARSGADRALRVTVSLGGQVRMCDPALAIGSGQMEACE